MQSGRQSTAMQVEEPAAVTISYQNPWDPERHGPAFLRPLVEGYRKRRPPVRPKDEVPQDPPVV